MPLLHAIITGVATGSVYGLAALGMNLQYGAARVLNLAYGDLMVAAALLTHLLYQAWGLSPILAMLALLPAAFLLHLMLYRHCFGPLGRRGGKRRPSEASVILLSFGLSFVVGGLLLATFGAQLYSYSYLLVPLELAGAVVPANRVVAFVLASVLVAVVHGLLNATRLGTAVRAAAMDPDEAPLVGIDVPRMATLAFAIGGAFCMAGGAALSMTQPVNVPMGVVFTLKALVVVVLGGVGNTLGTVVAGFLLGSVEAVVSQFVSPSLTLVATYGLFSAALLTSRTGLFRGITR